MNRQWKWFSAFAVVLLSAVAVQATTLVRQSLGQQIDQAELIFEGSVIHLETALTEKNGYPFTLVTFQVDRTFKGEGPANGELTLRFTGGETDEFVAHIPSVPVFEVGGRHLLFVAGNTKSLCPLVGWSQGKIDLRQHPESGAAILVDDSGWPISGIADGEWKRTEQPITHDGYWKNTETGIVLLEEDGVEIVDLKPQDAARAVDLPTADVVLAQLDAKVRRQQNRSTYRQPVPVVSATVADVPSSVMGTKGGAQ